MGFVEIGYNLIKNQEKRNIISKKQHIKRIGPSSLEICDCMKYSEQIRKDISIQSFIHFFFLKSFENKKIK